MIIESTLCLYRLYFERRVEFDTYPLICVLNCCCPTSPRYILEVYTDCIHFVPTNKSWNALNNTIFVVSNIWIETYDP